MQHRLSRVALLLILVATFLSPRDGEAQIRASERALVQQTVDGTVLTVDYARPRARGRPQLFGGKEVVHWDEVWTPGANEATTLRVSKPIRLNGHPVPAGKYSVWLVVREHGDWELLLDGDTTRFHTRRPKPDSAKVRFAVRPDSGAHMEVLTFAFTDVRSDGATLELGWGKLRLPLRIDVEPTIRRHVARAEVEPYLGRYEIVWEWGNKKPVPFDVRFAAADSTLRVDSRMEGSDGDEPEELMLLPLGGARFATAFLMNGDIGSADDELVLEFTTEDGRVTGFEIRSRHESKPLARGRRK